MVQPAAAPVTKQLPPHPGATAFGVSPATAVDPQPTGPVGFVPGPPGLGTPPPPPPPPPAVGPESVGSGAQPGAPAAPAPAWPESLEPEQTRRPRIAARIGLPQDRGVLAGVGLAVLALVVLQVGLALDPGSESLWKAVPLWSAFATVAAVVGSLAVLISSWPGGRPRADQAWRVGAAGLVGLSLFWLLVVLPRADSDRGFLLTAAVLCLGAALWTGAKRT